MDVNESLDDSESESGDLVNFDPTELVKNREGTPRSVSVYLSKHLRRCLTKEEREVLFSTVPKVDKYMSEYLGKQFPKDNEAQLTKIQAAILGDFETTDSRMERPPKRRTRGQSRHNSSRHGGTELDPVHHLLRGKCLRAHFSVQKREDPNSD